MNLRRIVHRLPGGRLVRRAYILVGGAVVGQVLLLLASPFLTRLYSPDDFGVLAVFLPLIAIGSVGGALRYEHAIALPEDDVDGMAILLLTFVLTLVTAIVLGAVVIAFGGPLTEWLNVPALEPLLWLVPIALIGAGFYQSLVLWNVRVSDYKRIASSRVSQSGAQVAVQLGAGAADWRPFGLVFGATVAWFASAATLGIRVVRKEWHLVRDVTWGRIRSVGGRYRRFPIFGTWSGFLNVAVLELPAVFVAALFDARVAGLFLLSRRIVAAPVVTVGQSVQHVYLGESSQVLREEPERLDALYRRTWQRLLVLSIPPALLLAVSAPFLFSLLFGEEWRDAGVYTSLLTPMLVAQVSMSPLAATYSILERQDVQLVRDAARLGLVLLAFGFAAWFDLTPVVTMILYSVSMVLGYVLLFAFGAREVRRVRDDAIARKAVNRAQGTVS
jgi:O-antigen/teichoic acid export membrane protein